MYIWKERDKGTERVIIEYMYVYVYICIDRERARERNERIII
jgi:hypothetical protein